MIDVTKMTDEDLVETLIDSVRDGAGDGYTPLMQMRTELLHRLRCAQDVPRLNWINSLSRRAAAQDGVDVEAIRAEERQRAVEICDLTLERMADRDACARAIRNPESKYPSKGRYSFPAPASPSRHMKGEAMPKCPECKVTMRDETAWYRCDKCQARYSSSMERGLYRLPEEQHGEDGARFRHNHIAGSNYCPACQARSALSSAPLEGWRKVDTEAPKVGEYVHLVVNGIVQMMPACIELKGFAGEEGKQWRWLDEEADPMPFELATHWQPLPSGAPLEAKGAGE